MLFNMAQIVKLLLIFEPDANNEPEHIIAIGYTEISLHIKHFMKHETYILKYLIDRLLHVFSVRSFETVYISGVFSFISNIFNTDSR